MRLFSLFVLQNGGEAGAVIVRLPSMGTLTTITGQEGAGYEDGPALSARFYYPTGVVKMLVKYSDRIISP